MPGKRAEPARLHYLFICTSLSYGQSPILLPICVSDMVMFFPPMFILMLPR